MAEPNGGLAVGRVYDLPEDDRGKRILVDRLWPRGLSKEAAALDGWCKVIAPSDELRRWYGHDPGRFEEFAARYRAELKGPDRAAALEQLVEMSRRETVRLLTATKDLRLSHAPILAEAMKETR
jgi:uncharacterized protein YeaO (DUF488 family)